MTPWWRDNRLSESTAAAGASPGGGLGPSLPRMPTWQGGSHDHRSSRNRTSNDARPERRSQHEMCLNCGCMRAHDDMGNPEINITYEDVKRAADANKMTVDATLAMIARTSDKDRADHPAEYRAQMARDMSRLDDDGGPSVLS